MHGARSFLFFSRSTDADRNYAKFASSHHSDASDASENNAAVIPPKYNKNNNNSSSNNNNSTTTTVTTTTTTTNAFDFFAASVRISSYISLKNEQRTPEKQKRKAEANTIATNTQKVPSSSSPVTMTTISMWSKYHVHEVHSTNYRLLLSDRADDQVGSSPTQLRSNYLAAFAEGGGGVRDRALSACSGMSLHRWTLWGSYG